MEMTEVNSCQKSKCHGCAQIYASVLKEYFKVVEWVFINYYQTLCVPLPNKGPSINIVQVLKFYGLLINMSIISTIKFYNLSYMNRLSCSGTFVNLLL